MYGKTWIKKDCFRKEKVKLICSKNWAQMIRVWKTWSHQEQRGTDVDR